MGNAFLSNDQCPSKDFFFFLLQFYKQVFRVNRPSDRSNNYIYIERNGPSQLSAYDDKATSGLCWVLNKGVLPVSLRLVFIRNF
jgi:hypothetical protein